MIKAQVSLSQLISPSTISILSLGGRSCVTHFPASMMIVWLTSSKWAAERRFATVCIPQSQWRNFGLTDKMILTEFDKKAEWDFKALSGKFGVLSREMQ